MRECLSRRLLRWVACTQRHFTHTSTPVVRLIRNRDTAVIIRLNNSLSPGLSKNKPMMPPSLCIPPPSPPSSSLACLSFHRWKTNCRSVFRENWEKLLLFTCIFKGSGARKRKQTDRIDPIARNKDCHTAVTERPSSRHYFLRIAQTGLLLHGYSWSSTFLVSLIYFSLVLIYQNNKKRI